MDPFAALSPTCPFDHHFDHQQSQRCGGTTTPEVLNVPSPYRDFLNFMTFPSLRLNPCGGLQKTACLLMGAYKYAPHLLAL